MRDVIGSERQALDNCAREPIHRPGTIQPFGALLAGPIDLSRVSHASANLEGVLGRSADQVLGASFQTVLGGKVVHDIRNLLSYPTSATQRERLTRMTDNGCEIYIHRNANKQAVIELEPVLADDAEPSRMPVDQMRLILAQAAQQSNMTRFLNVCVHGLRDLVGYDRVMAYRYAANGDGEVVAEARGVGIESFLGLHYPAHDVPEQARALQVRNPVRMLTDVAQQPIPILAQEGDPGQLDIALAHLRGISPIHVEYLGNMGVGATLTIGLVVDGRLWGMFACHHMAPRVVRSSTRIAAELFGQMISLLIQQKLELASTDARARAEEARRRILAETDSAAHLLAAFDHIGPILETVIDGDGLAVIDGEEIATSGSVPPAPAIAAIAARRVGEEDVVDSTDALANSDWAGGTDLAGVAGCMQIRSTAVAPLQVLFFRDEVTRNIRWAGKPDKDVEVGPLGARLTPRGSFEAFLESQAGKSVPWTPFDAAAARELQKLLGQVATKSDRAKMARHKEMVAHQRQQDLMIAELNHRVKNILALIRSLSRQTRASSKSLESYALALESRIAALAAAHDLAVSNTMQGVSLRGILETELQPYMAVEAGQVLLSGPVLGLRADVAPMIALVLHEVVTNATKYGALSVPDGIVRVRWSRDEAGLSLQWSEIGGPPVTPPERNGFGRTLIEKAIPYEFDGTVEMGFAATGVTLSLTLPETTLVDLESDAVPRVAGPIAELEGVARGRRLLLVEDNVVLAMDMVESLTRMGAAAVETAGTLEEANRLIDRGDFDMAVLDLNLRGAVSFALGERLQAEGTPFVFVTGYGDGLDMPPPLRDVEVLTKPIDEGSLSAAIRRALA